MKIDRLIRITLASNEPAIVMSEEQARELCDALYLELEPEARLAVSYGTCLFCSCTETRPCIDIDGPCAWANEAHNVCTACARRLLPELVRDTPIPPIPEDPRSFEEIHAEESAVPLADELPAVDPLRTAAAEQWTHGPANLDEGAMAAELAIEVEPVLEAMPIEEPRQIRGDDLGSGRLTAVLVDASEVNLSPPASEEALCLPDREPWEEKLLELWHKVRGKYPDEPDSTVAGRVYIYTCRHKDPNLNRLYTADIRRELRHLGIDIADPRSCAPKSRPGPKPESVTPPPPTNPEPVADPPPAPASGQPFDVAAGIVQLWHRYRPMFAKDAGVIARIMQVTRSPKWGGIRTPAIRAILREQGIHVEEPAKNQHDSRKPSGDVHVAEPSNEPQVQQEPKTARPSNVRQINPAMLEPPKVEAAPEPKVKSIEKCVAPGPEFGVESTLQLIHAFTDRTWPVDFAAVMHELRPENDYGQKIGASAIPLDEVREFESEHRDWLKAYASLPPFRRRDIDLELVRDWRSKKVAA